MMVEHPKGRRQDLHQSVGVVDVHPVACVWQEVHARPQLLHARHVRRRPHKRRPLRAHKVHLKAVRLRLQHGPQVRRLVRLIHVHNTCKIEGPRQCPVGSAWGGGEVSGHPLRALGGESRPRECVHQRTACGDGHGDGACESYGVARVVACLAPHVARHCIEHPHLHGARQLTAELVYHRHRHLAPEAVPQQRVRVYLEVV
mmetsp:Transcript_6853/g.17031  ORF Transcript_6853/g.17031 Transcript_6853/m.17031 type:complete len:201 (-) Transcript_6853:959-1561(-)